MNLLNNNTLEFEIIPPKLSCWMAKNEKDSRIILFNVQFDLVEGVLKVYMDIAIDRISIRRGYPKPADYYIGCTGAEVIFEVNNGKIISYTPPSKINIKYENEEVLKRSTALKLSSKNGNGGVSLEYSKDQAFTFKTSFQAKESTLEALHTTTTVKWEYALPRQNKAIRDYLMGNLYLNAEVIDYVLGEIEGSFYIKPSNFYFFGKDKRELGYYKSALMWLFLYHKGKILLDENGFEIKFRQQK